VKTNVTVPVVAHQSHKAITTNKEEPIDPSREAINDPRNIGVKVKGCVEPICLSLVDVVVLVDVSGGVGNAGLQKVKDMLQKFPYHFYPPPEDWSDGQFLALMSYGKYAKIHVQWTGDKKEFQDAAKTMKLYWGAGDLGAGLTKATQLHHYSRPDSFHNVLVITDGGSYSRTRANLAAERLGMSGATIYTVVVEEFVGPAHDEMFEVIQSAGQFPANSFMMSVDSYDDLDTDWAIKNMVYMLCPETANLLSIDRKVVRRVMDGNRTALDQTTKVQRSFRKN